MFRHLATLASLLIVGLILIIVVMLSGTLIMGFRMVMDEIIESDKVAVEALLLIKAEERGSSLARLLAEELTDPMFQVDEAGIQDLVRFTKEEKGIDFVFLYDAAGVLVSDGTMTLEAFDKPTDESVRNVMATGKSFTRSTKNDLYTAVPIKVGSRLLGSVVIGVSLAQIIDEVTLVESALAEIEKSSLQSLILVTIVLALALAGLGFFLAFQMGRWLARPIEAIAEITGQIGQGNYKAHVPIERSDEIGDLAKSVNQMANQLDQSQRVQEKSLYPLEQKKFELEKSEARFRGIFESGAVGTLVFNDSGVIEMFNSTAQAIFGYTPEEMIGTNVHALIPESNFTGRDGFSPRDTSTNEPMIGGTETMGLGKNGNEIALHLAISKIAGEHKSHIGSITDLTELKSIERQLARAQKMDAIGQLTGGIAHDFNNLITIIIGQAELLEQHLEADKNALEEVKPILEAARRAADVTKRLLDLSSDRVVEAAVVDINQLILDMTTLFERSLTPQVRIEHDLAEDLWPTEINPGDFVDSLINVVLNARDAMDGRGCLTLKTTNQVVDTHSRELNHGSAPGECEYVRLAVTDSGEGISMEQQEHIFDPFFTTKAMGQGTGLGLTMVYGFVKRSGGFIECHSELGVGTTLGLYLPRAARPAQPQEATSDESVDRPRGTETVLVVDDEERLRKLARIHLGDLGYRVLVASDGNQALERLADEPAISLLLTDVVMSGGINGYELAKQATAHRPDLKVIITTGYAERPENNIGHARFAAALLSKPYSLNELAQRVRAVLDD